MSGLSPQVSLGEINECENLQGGNWAVSPRVLVQWYRVSHVLAGCEAAVESLIRASANENSQFTNSQRTNTHMCQRAPTNPGAGRRRNIRWSIKVYV